MVICCLFLHSGWKPLKRCLEIVWENRDERFPAAINTQTGKLEIKVESCQLRDELKNKAVFRL